MTSERDDLDDRLLAEGRYAELVAAYYPAMLARLRMRLPTGAVFDVAHDVAERLLRELPGRMCTSANQSLGINFAKSLIVLVFPLPAIGWRLFNAGLNDSPPTRDANVEKHHEHCMA